jgi:hypothetical protein
MSSTRASASVMICLLGACAGEAGTAKQGPPTTSVDFQLQTHEQGGVLTGSAVVNGATLSFEAHQISADATDLSYELGGLTFTYTVDKAGGVIETDGFATTTGADTQFGDADRANMLGLAHALDTVGKNASPLLALTRQVASGAADWPDSVDARREQYAVADRDYTSICWAVNSYQWVTHDCWDYNDWDDPSTLEGAWLSMNAAGPCDDGTYFWTGNQWVCYEPDHDPNIEYAYGNCFGRCGDGCGSSTQFTWDCADHDSCVRTGHDTASFWCDDEFTSTLDDWALAPNC